MARIVIKDLKSKKSLTQNEIKEVIGGGFFGVPLSRLAGRVVYPKTKFRINPNWLSPSNSTQNTSCCDGYDCDLGCYV